MIFWFFFINKRTFLINIQQREKFYDIFDLYKKFSCSFFLSFVDLKWTHWVKFNKKGKNLLKYRYNLRFKWTINCLTQGLCADKNEFKKYKSTISNLYSMVSGCI